MENVKIKIIQRLIRKLASDREVEKGFLIRAQNYTGLHQNTLIALMRNVDVKINIEPLERSEIYSKLWYFYAAGDKLPTTYELFNDLVMETTKQKKTPHWDIESFRKILLKMDFIWKKVSDSRVVVIEKPLVRFERFNYLKQIKNERNQRYNDIYFVDENAYNAFRMYMDIETSREFEKLSNGCWQQRVVYAVGVNEVICFKEIDDFNAKAFQDFMTDLCAALIRPSCIVVQDLDHHNAKLIETPTHYSTRDEMMAWLFHFDVPYDMNMSKLDLYNLIEEYTNIDEPIYKIDEIVKAHGHTLLRIPKSIKELTKSGAVFRLIENNMTAVNGFFAKEVELNTEYKDIARRCFRIMIGSVTKNHLETFTKPVVDKEGLMLKTECIVDKALERLMTNKYNPSAQAVKDDSDVVSCSDSE